MFAANIITKIINIEDQLRLEYPKRNRGRPAAHQLIIRPDFKILVYDLTCVTIRTTRAHDKVQDLFALNEEPNPVSEDKSDWVTIDGKMIYNKYAINDLRRMISEEIDWDKKPDFIIDANQNNLQY